MIFCKCTALIQLIILPVGLQLGARSGADVAIEGIDVGTCVVWCGFGPRVGLLVASSLGSKVG